MRRQLKGWLKKKKILILSVFVVLVFVLSVGISFLWADDEVSKARQAGESVGRSVQGALGSSSALNQKLFMPLLTPAPMYPLGGNESQGFRAQILCPSAKEFLKVVVASGSTGDLTLYIYYDKGFTGSLNTSLVVSGVSAVCSNGFMKCNPGTMSDCSSYVFYLDGNELKYRMAVVSTGYGLSGCFCVNNACGGSNVLIANLDYVLRAVGGMVVSAFLNDPSRSSYVVSDSKIDGMSITFYGQDSSQCQFADQGSSSVQNLKTYYQNPGSLSSAGNALLGNQMGDSQSMASMVYKSTQLSTGDVRTCVIRRVASGCSVVEKTEGDCNVSSSCKVVEESWDGVPIIQGGARTKLNPVGSCVMDECGNLHCYDWTTRRVVYVCSGERVFDPSPRIETVTRSTTWDRATGMVYYNDLVIPNDCSASCPSGYVYSYASKNCEADPVCPSGSVYDSTTKLCKVDPICPSGYTYNSQIGTCQSNPTCDSGFTYDSVNKVCTIQGQTGCPNGGTLQNVNGQSKCVLTPNTAQPSDWTLKCPKTLSGWSYVSWKFIGYDIYDNSTYGNPYTQSPENWTGFEQHGWNLACIPNVPGCVKYCARSGGWSGTTYYCCDQGNDTCYLGREGAFTSSGLPASDINNCTYNTCRPYFSCNSSFSSGGTCWYRNVCIWGEFIRDSSQDGIYFVAPQKGTPICAQGQYLNSQTGLCEYCPSGYTYDTSLHLCLTDPGISCPSGSTYDSNLKLCVATPSCSQGGSFNQNTALCEVAPICPSGFSQTSNSTQESCNDCPSGYVYDSSNKICVADLSCPGGGSLVYDSGRLRCEANLQGSSNCPSGSSYDAGLNICYTSVSCSSGTFDQNVGACVASLSCPSGANYDSASKLCEEDPSCPEGTAYNDETGKCEGDPVCQQGSVWDASLARCASCPSGYVYDSVSKLCKSNDGSTTDPTFSLPCSEGAIFNPNTSLCEGAPICPSGLSFDRNLNTCVATPTCPSGFSFDSNWGTCVAVPNCPTGFTLDASRGICVVQSSTSCPSGYVYDSSLGKCVFAISCPGGGAWDVALGKCVKQSFCVSSSSSSYCVATPSCPSGGVWDENMGKCVIETACSSQSNWVLQSGKSFYLGKGSDSSDCEFVCKIKVVEPKSCVYMKSSSTTFDLQYGTKTEKTGVSSAESYYYKPCIEEATNTWRCPIEEGEQMVDDCKCINNFGQAATIMQAIRQAGQDFICSSGKLY